VPPEDTVAVPARLLPVMTKGVFSVPTLPAAPPLQLIVGVPRVAPGAGLSSERLATLPASAEQKFMVPENSGSIDFDME